MNRVVHFEIHAGDTAKLKTFYQDLFGWQMQDTGPEMGNYIIVTTGPRPDEMAKGVQMEDVGINGGMTPRRGPAAPKGAPVNAFVCTVGVADVDAMVAKATSLGGTIALGKMGVPGVGWLAYILDPENNIFGMLQNDPNATMMEPQQ